MCTEKQNCIFCPLPGIRGAGVCCRHTAHGVDGLLLAVLVRVWGVRGWSPLPGTGIRGKSPLPGTCVRGSPPLPGTGVRGKPPLPGTCVRGTSPPLPGTTTLGQFSLDQKSTAESVSTWMRSICVVRASDCQCRSRNNPRFDPSIYRHSEI
jgi:hypothetical protein